MKFLAIYFIIGLIYSNFTLIKNYINNPSYPGESKCYRDESIKFKLISYLMDLFIWPFGIFSDIYFNQKED